jgi:hypothetical protein
MAKYVRVSSLACEAYHVLLVAITIVFLRLCVASMNVIIGAMMDCESSEGGRKDDANFWSYVTQASPGA